MDWHECLRRGLLMKDEFHEDDIGLSMKRAEEWLIECEKDIDSEAYGSAIFAGYLAMFHSARAILYNDGYREKSHYCVARYLERYVENNMLENEWVSLLDYAREVRHADQYNVGFVSTEEDAKEMYNTAVKFVKRMKQLLEEIKAQ